MPVNHFTNYYLHLQHDCPPHHNQHRGTDTRVKNMATAAEICCKNFESLSPPLVFFSSYKNEKLKNKNCQRRQKTRQQTLPQSSTMPRQGHRNKPHIPLHKNVKFLKQETKADSHNTASPSHK